MSDVSASESPGRLTHGQMGWDQIQLLQEVGWNAELDPIVAVDANVAGGAFVVRVARVWTWASWQLNRGENCSWLDRQVT